MDKPPDEMGVGEAVHRAQLHQQKHSIQDTWQVSGTVLEKPPRQGAWGDSTANKVLSVVAQGPEFRSPVPM